MRSRYLAWAALWAGIVVFVGGGAMSAKAATTYYIDGDNAQASDSNPGTLASPWKTIQKAANTMVAGDTAIVSPGTYTEQVSSKANGTALLPITFKTSGSPVTMRGWSISHNYNIMNGFTVTGGGGSQSVNITGAYSQVISNTIHDTSSSSQDVYLGGSSNLFGYNHLYSSIAYGDDHPVVRIDGVGNLAANNEIGPYLDPDGFRPFGHDHVIRSNYLHDCGPSGGSAAHCDVFQVYGDNGETSYNITFENNYVLNWTHAIFMTSTDIGNLHDFDVRNNVYVNVAQQGNIGVPDFRFYNNLLYNVDTQNGICIILYGGTYGYANNAMIKNNIMIGPGGLNNSSGLAYIYSDWNNNWYSSRTSVGITGDQEDYNYITGAPASGYPALGNFSEAHGINGGDPKFNNLAVWDFHLKAGSPSIDKGVTLANVNCDKDGVIRPQGAGWDIGPYEFGVTDTNPPVISAVQAAALSANSARVTWTTDEAATSVVQFGLTTSYGSAASDGTLTANHSVTLTGLTANTSYHYRVQSVDASGNASSFTSDRSFSTSAPDTTPPTVAVTAPVSMAVVSGLTTLAATAGDNVAVVGVQFLVDGQAVGAEATNAPYTFGWDSYLATNGTHSVQARARDASGNSTLTLPAITVQVQNAVPIGLVGYWPFNEGSGTQASDLSGQNETVTLNGAGWGAGRIGSGSLSLNGSSASANVADSAALRLSGDATVSLWVKHTAIPASGSWMYYVEKGLDNSENYALGAYTDSGGTRLFFEFVDSTGTYQYCTQGTGAMLSAGVWTHVAAAFDHTHGQLVFFINGQQVKSIALAQSLKATTDPLVIGQQNVSGYEFWMNGLVDDLRIYNRALTGPEVQVLSLSFLGTASQPVVSGQKSANGYVVSLQGVVGATYVLDASSNLLTWVPVVTNVSPFSLTNIISAPGGAFYRGRVPIGP
jgi:Concanavalin A-like lectin/glucanases superfamily/Bacterial Ig domain/Purple acid Phosphatase, N-terminal domain